MAKRKDVDMIPANLKLSFLLLGIGALPFILEFFFSGVGLFTHPKSRAEIHAQAIAIGCLLWSLVFSHSYIFDEEGITFRFFCIPYRKIKWVQVEMIVICQETVSPSTLLVLKKCPKPNVLKNETYDNKFSTHSIRHFLKTIVLSEAEKHIHLIEKYWPGEIENKAILYMKKE